MDISERIREAMSQMTLDLDCDDGEIKQQVKRISLAQKQLKLVKKELSSEVKNINQQISQQSADSWASVANDLLGNRRGAGRVRAQNRRSLQQRKKNLRQPYYDLMGMVDEEILKGDKLKLLAEEFFLDPEGVKSRWEAEKKAEEERLRAEEERLRLEEEKERLKPEWLKIWESFRRDLLKFWQFFRTWPWWVQLFAFLLLLGLIGGLLS